MYIYIFVCVCVCVCVCTIKPYAIKSDNMTADTSVKQVAALIVFCPAY